MVSNTQIWWAVLCALAFFNAGAWVWTAATLHRRQALSGAPGWPHRALLWLAAGYVLGCGYRSVFPVYDVQRLVLVDSWLSSVLVGRSVATVAELCFAAQWAVVLNHVAGRAGSARLQAVSRLILPLIAAAEVCSWMSVLTTSNLGHVFEESLWGLSAALVAGSLLWASSDGAGQPREVRRWTVACAVAAAAYVVFMFGVDVPMYWARFVADEAAGRTYLGVAEGFVDVATRWTAVHDWQHWKSEVVWMTLYFSLGVWLSIALARGPAPPRAATARRTRQLASLLPTR